MPLQHMEAIRSDKSMNNRSSSMNLMIKREYRVTRRVENPLFYGGVALAVGAMTAQVGLQISEMLQKQREESAAAAEAGDDDNDNDDDDKSKDKNKERKSSREESSMFGSWFARNFYQGGFEDKMTKREAALILGVREHADISRIKNAHRKILILNHPDRGGSPLLAAKINEAKDLNVLTLLDNKKILNISQLASLIKDSSFVVANDTGPAHMAAHLNVKGLTLFGKHTTAFKVSIERENFKPIQVEDLNNLSAEKVFERLSEIL